MMFETAKVQQNEVDQEIIKTLTSQIDEQNEKPEQVIRESKEQALVGSKPKSKLE